MAHSRKKPGRRYTPPARKVEVEGHWVPVDTAGVTDATTPAERALFRRVEALGVLGLLVDDRRNLDADIREAVEQALAYGATQRQVAEVLGVSQPSVSKRYGSRWS